MALAERPSGGIERAPVRRPSRPVRPRAVMDVRLPWPLGRAVVVAAILSGILFGLATAVLGSTQYHGELSLLVFKLNNPSPTRGIEIVDRRVTAMTAIARSQPFVIELQRESGVDIPLEELQDMIDATRPNLGAIALITVTGTDREVVERLTAHLSTAMSEVVDRLRVGSLQLVDANGLNIAAGDDPDYTGPLYLEPFSDLSGGAAPKISETSPRVAVNVVVGAVLGVLALVTAGALAHERARATDREDLEQLLDLEQLGGLPRPDRRHAAGSARAVLGFANALAASSAREPHAVAVAGAGTARLRRRLAACLARASAAVTGRPVVLVDLDPARLSRRRSGILDADAAGLGDLLRPLPRWTVPRWARRLGRDIPVLRLQLGRRAMSVEEADDLLAAAVSALREHHVVIVNLPRIPGPIPAGSVVGVVDCAALLVLDGWTSIDDAHAVADAVEAGAEGPVGFALVEN